MSARQIAAGGAPRWMTSFADLLMLLLGFFVLLYAGAASVGDVAASTREAFGGPPAVAPLLDSPARALFERGEARLTEGSRARVEAAGRRAASAGWSVRVESIGRDPATHRFDGWELAAARAAAVARALSAAGLPERRVTIVMPEQGNDRGQRLIVRR